MSRIRWPRDIWNGLYRPHMVRRLRLAARRPAVQRFTGDELMAHLRALIEERPPE